MFGTHRKSSPQQHLWLSEHWNRKSYGYGKMVTSKHVHENILLIISVRQNEGIAWNTHHAEKIPSDEECKGPSHATTIRFEGIRATRIDKRAEKQNQMSVHMYVMALFVQIVHVLVPAFTETQALA